MTIHKSKFLATITLFTIGAIQYISAQTNSLSAYTSFGVGRIENSGSVSTQGMGGAGLALPSENKINYLNAASLAGVDSLEMLFDFGLGVNNTTFSSKNGDGNAISGGLNNLGMALKLTRHINTSFGIARFSSIGYNVESSSFIDGGNSEIYKSYEGSGGIDEVYFSNSISIFKNFSLGLKLSYLFGQVNKTEYYFANEIGGELQLDYADYLRKVFIEPSFQYHLVTKNNTFSFGGTYSPNTVFNSSRTVTTSSTSGAGIVEDLDVNDYELPTMMAGGVAWQNKNGFKLALDYRLQKWSEVYYSSSRASYKDSHKFAGGIEYRNVRTKKRSPYIWQFGAYYEDSYLKVKGKTIIDRGFTAGIGIPVKNNDSHLNVSLNYGKRGTNDNSLITEEYIGVGLSLSISEQWFKKQQFK